MNLIEKAGAVEQVLLELDEAISKFQNWSSLKCTFGCGRCCFKPDIEASSLEFLPLALKIYREGKIDMWHERFENNNEEKICMVLDPRQLGAGLCTQYQHRGLVCRAFGFTARFNKYNRKELLTCNVIKSEQVDTFKQVIEQINVDQEVPIISNYYFKLHSIDPYLANQFVPINQAIKRALELISQYFSYKGEEELIVPQ